MNPGAVQPQYPTISNLLTNQEGCKCSNVHKWGSTVPSKHHSQGVKLADQNLLVEEIKKYQIKKC